MTTLKKCFTAILLLTTFTFIVRGQTIVSDSILTNTIWTVGGSPYIIEDTVIIGYGVELTIDPGVTVKFEDNALLEIYSDPPYNGFLSAIGTAADSITFTSNSLNPFPGIYNGIRLWHGNLSESKFKYCNFKYADIAVKNCQLTFDVLEIKNSTFSLNNVGVQQWYARFMTIDSCVFKYNTYGLHDVVNTTIANCNISNNQIGYYQPSNSNVGGISIKNCTLDSNVIAIKGLASISTVDSCIIRYNQYGIDYNFNPQFGVTIKRSNIDSNVVAGIIIRAKSLLIDSCQINSNGIGIIDSTHAAYNRIYRNTIANNTIGIKIATSNDVICGNEICNNTLYDIKSMTSANIDLGYNEWCTNDSTSTASVIFDGNDSIGLGLVSFMPIDSVEACDFTVDMPPLTNRPDSFKLFPNPTSNLIYFITPNNSSKSGLKIYNTIGELILTLNLDSQKTSIDISMLTNGIYILELAQGTTVLRQKFIKE